MHVIEGEVFDVAVDLREDSLTLGKHVAVRLNGENKQLFYIPRGFAHGFLVMRDKAVFSYKVDSYYHYESERTLNWNDKELKIKWPLTEQEIQLSEKDGNGMPWEKLSLKKKTDWEA